MVLTYLPVQVMWLDKDSTQLSFGTEVYHPDRYDVHHPYPRDWNLEVISVRTDDAGTYECRIGTQPPARKYVQLTVHGEKTVIGYATCLEKKSTVFQHIFDKP